MNEPLHIISLGAGVQSSTMALMAACGEITPMPTAAIFADTQDVDTEELHRQDTQSSDGGLRQHALSALLHRDAKPERLHRARPARGLPWHLHACANALHVFHQRYL